MALSPSTEPLRLAIVGLGRMGSTHLRALAGSRRVRACAVVDAAPGARDRALALGLHGYASVDELLAAGVVEAALVAAPTPLHTALATTLLEAGIPVLCEKPLGLSLAAAADAGRVAERTSTPLMIAYWRRFVPALQRLRERILTGELGEISQIGCWQWDAERPDEAFRISSGGIAVDLGVHEFDQIRWLTGQELSAFTVAAAAVPGAPAVDGDPDSVAMLGRLSGGGIALVSLGRRFVHGDACWTEVWGTRGHVRESFLWGAEAETTLLRALAAQADAFAELIRGGRSAGADAADAVATLETALQATAALRVGRV